MMARKNTKIHFVIETSTKELLIREAQMQEVSLAELCRQKLKRNSKLLKIEMMLEELNKKLIENGKIQ